MNEEAAVMLVMALWVMIAYALYSKFWVVRRLRNKLEAITDAAIAAQPAIARQPAAPLAAERDEMRRIQQRLQVLERIAVEKENGLAREIDDLRAANG